VHAGSLITKLSARFPEVSVALSHGPSLEIVANIRGGRLDAGFYNETEAPDSELATIEVAKFGIVVVAAPGVVTVADSPDWPALAQLPWVYPTSSACCGRTAERLFATHRFRPQRVVDVDREDATRTLVANGTGIGLLHTDTVAKARGEVDVLFECETVVRVLFAHLASRAQDPLLVAASSIVREGQGGP
jgi:DNA-binding transcriptional LysR family regulator